jgi:branched-chain amino acid transport system permease protein
VNPHLGKIWAVHLGLAGLLLAFNWLLPAYHHTNLARIMVLAIFAMGYNIAFGFTGLLSLGHAMLFAAGMYGAGLTSQFLQWTALPALVSGLLAGGVMAAMVGLLALRTKGVSFMIVTLMFAQTGYLCLLYFGALTGGDEGLVIASPYRVLAGLDLAAEEPRYLVAWALFSVALIGNLLLVRAPFGRIMVAMRENEDRSQMLGYDPYRTKLIVMIISGVYAGAAGAAYGLMFGYVGASFATIQYSILPLLWVLLGGAGVVLGPFIGALVMFYLIDISSSYTTANLGVVGVSLLILVLFAPRGLLGLVRERLLPWLP